MKKEEIIWSAKLAYAVGLIATDGCLSIDGRHIDLTSKDIEQIQNFKQILNLTNKIATKSSGRNNTKKYFRIQFGNIKFYRFLLEIGLTPHKSKTIGKLLIPPKYMLDFLRGSLDGDGCTYSYWDPRWKSSFMLYTSFVSASNTHLLWIRDYLENRLGLIGKITKGRRAYQLRYAKKASVILLNKIYYKKNLICLSRKHSKIISALSIIPPDADVL